MARNFKIKENKQSLPKWQNCWICDKEISGEALYVEYGNGIYHLSCFKKYGEKLVKRWNLFKKNIQKHLNMLKPYNKEMIIENLER